MPRALYLGTKIHRRITSVVHEHYQIPGYPSWCTSYAEQTVQEVHPGEVIEDLRPDELAAFGDRFALVEDAPDAAPAPAQAEPHDAPPRTRRHA